MRVMLLDIGNVILNFDFSVFCKKLSHGDKAKESFILNKYCNGKYKENFDRGNLSPSEFFNMIEVDTQVDSASIIKYWKNIFSEVDGGCESIDKLKKYYSIWIVSDTDPVHFDYFLNKYSGAGRFDRHYTSFSIGILKNDPGFFRHILKSGGLSPSDCILVDDKYDNCNVANLAGIESILFRDWNSAQKNLMNKVRS